MPEPTARRHRVPSMCFSFFFNDTATTEIYTLSLHDALPIHVGSRTFLEDKWSKVSAWLGGDDEVARSIRYLIVSGDVVDGIGVYPRQDEELAIDDIYGQYEALATMMAALPDRIAVVMSPGNHDAVRPAEPQPAFPTSIQKLFDSNITFAGNPCLLGIEGVRIL